MELLIEIPFCIVLSIYKKMGPNRTVKCRGIVQSPSKNRRFTDFMRLKTCFGIDIPPQTTITELPFIPTPQPKLRGELISEETPQKASALDEVSHESSVRYAFCGARAR